MSFRKIRPSFRESSASASNPSQSTSESTGSDPRHVRGEKESTETSNSSLSSKRRRVPESVTRNACLNCKKARAKCDGKKPCKRCATRLENSECIYEIHIKHAKEELVKQIKDLKAKDHMTEQILQALSTDEKVPEILDRLKNGETYESIVDWLGRAPLEDSETLSPRLSQHSTLDVSDYEMGGVSSTNFRWTSVTSNTAILDHLFQLYFAWIHPVHTLFSEGHFVDSYKRQSERYCSSNLVNAICSMACHLHSTADGDEIDFEQLGTEFSEAVRSNIDPDDRSIATIQAFAVMFLVEIARGQGLRASSYLQVATSILSSVDYHQDESPAEVWGNTVRGVRNLNVEWAQMTFQVPPDIKQVPNHDVEENDEEIDAAKWYFYRYFNDQCPAWPGLLATTNREKSKLTVIIQDVVTMMYTHYGPQVTANNLLQQYSRLVAWREDLPSVIGNIENNNGQALPHMLSLLILYSNTVVHLLRPLLDLESFPSPLIEEIIWNHAQQGLFLLDEHYRTHYTCRYQPVLQMFSLLHLTDLVARFFPGGIEGGSKDGPEAIQFGLEALTQSRAGFPVAGPLQALLRKTANECSIRFPLNEIVAAPTPKGVYRMDDLIDACTRPSYTQPINQIHWRYLPSVSADWVAEGAAFGFFVPVSGARKLRIPSAEEKNAQSLMQISNLLNTS